MRGLSALHGVAAWMGTLLPCFSMSTLAAVPRSAVPKFWHSSRIGVVSRSDASTASLKACLEKTGAT